MSKKNKALVLVIISLAFLLYFGAISPNSSSPVIMWLMGAFGGLGLSQLKSG